MNFSNLSDRVNSSLSARARKGMLRKLRQPLSTAWDFSSNDYLGFARCNEFKDFVNGYIEKKSPKAFGSTGSRLLSGHSSEIEHLEEYASIFHKSEDALLFNSGYDANLSLLSSLPSVEDAIVYDEMVHASMHDGMRMGRARQNRYKFKHNNLKSMVSEIISALSHHNGSVIVCVESVYSMDGDIAPVRKILHVCGDIQRKTNREIHVIVDEAHSGGIFGPAGEGIIVESSCESHKNLLARIITFGKAFCAHGAVVLTAKNLKEYLINYARPLIYSTAMTPHNVLTIEASYMYMKSAEAKRARLHLESLIEHFTKKRKEIEKLLPELRLIPYSKTAIQGLQVGGNEDCIRVGDFLRKRGFDVYEIRWPTVSRGSERIRIIIHAHNTKEQIDRLSTALVQAIDEVKARPRL